MVPPSHPRILVYILHWHLTVIPITLVNPIPVPSRAYLASRRGTRE